MKKVLTFLIVILFLFDIIDRKVFNRYYYNTIIDIINKNDYKLVINSDEVKPNTYTYKNYSTFVKNTSNYLPKNKQEILNIYYTALNNGLDDFSFYCDDNYTNCFNDLSELSDDSDKFTYINHLIHPYYSFSTIESNFNIDKRVDITINKRYSNEDIEKIDEKMNEIINNLNINSYSTIRDKIKVFHDYIASINTYDENKEKNASIYNSDTAIGTLFENHSICSGYTDTMAIFLGKLGLENVKIMTDKHTWNAVKIDNNWYHIDLTWDDPIVKNGKQVILYDYFLISTDELLEKNDNEHNYDKNIFNFIY